MHPDDAVDRQTIGFKDFNINVNFYHYCYALPFDIRSARLVSIFKAKLKTHLFRHAFFIIVVVILVSLLLIVILAFEPFHSV